MAMTDQQEATAIQRYKAANSQNKRYPMLINIDDGRLVPNVPLLGGRKEVRDPVTGKVIQNGRAPHPQYRVYMGDPKAPRAERLRILRQSMGMESAPVVDAGFVEKQVQAFDIANANAEELVAFAKEQYGLNLSPNTPMHLLRGRIKAKAVEHGDMPAPAGKGTAEVGDGGDDDLS